MSTHENTWTNMVMVDHGWWGHAIHRHRILCSYVSFAFCLSLQ